MLDHKDPVYSVDWEAATEAGYPDPPEEVKHAVAAYGTHHLGNFDADVPDEWLPGGDYSFNLMEAMDEHGHYVIPGEGPQPTSISVGGQVQEVLIRARGDEPSRQAQFPLYAPLDPAFLVGTGDGGALSGNTLDVDTEALEAVATLSDHKYSIENSTFAGELRRFLDAAAELKANLDLDFVPVDSNTPPGGPIQQRFTISEGQYGPDALGNFYVSLQILGEYPVEELPLEGTCLGVEKYEVEDHTQDPQESRTHPAAVGLGDNPEGEQESGDDDSVGEVTQITLRHERYTAIDYSDEPWGERTQALIDRLHQESHFASLISIRGPTGGPIDEQMEPRGYNATERDISISLLDGEEMVEFTNSEDDVEQEQKWVIFPAATFDEPRMSGIIFSSPPQRDDIVRAIYASQIADAFHTGEAQAVFQCTSCDEWSHWLGSHAPDTIAVEDMQTQLELAKKSDCGCST